MRPVPDTRPGPGWLYVFVLIQYLCQIALIASGPGPTRLALRVSVFGSSLAFLALIPAGSRRHPSTRYVAAVLGITALSFFHPNLNTVLAGLSQVALVFAVWSPLFWVGRVRLTPETLHRLVLLVWGFNALSAAVGVLQVYDDRFAPTPEFVRLTNGNDYADSLIIELDDGRKVFRPSGLTDSPGGAGLAGSLAVLGGLGVAATSRHLLVRLASLPAAVVGVVVILLSQVRLTMILTGFGAAVIIAMLALRGRLSQAVVTVLALTAVTGGGFVWAMSVGSDVVLSRLVTLVEDPATDVYYKNRGHFVEDTVTHHIPDYPFGAGLGRWGMMHMYFGNPADPDSPPLWAEVQVTGWVFDGGVFLLLAGLLAVGSVCATTVLVALRTRQPGMAELAVTITAYNAGVVATLFGAHVFVTQSGMLFCFLNAALYAAARAPQPAAR